MMCGKARPANLTPPFLSGLFACCFWVGLAVLREKASYLVAVHHEVVGGNQGFEDHHPARVGRPLK